MIYSDIIKQGLILPKKQKYTKQDCKKLLQQGFSIKQAKFIVICSSIFYGTEASNFCYK